MKVFNSEAKLIAKYGKDNAKLIIRRMQVLFFADTLAEVSHQKPTRRHQLKGNRSGEFAVDLAFPFRLVFEPNHSPVPKKHDSGIDLDEITAIIINGVEDYH